MCGESFLNLRDIGNRCLLTESIIVAAFTSQSVYLLVNGRMRQWFPKHKKCMLWLKVFRYE